MVRNTSGRQWVIARKIVQTLMLAVFLALFVGSRRGGWPESLVNIPLRLDPLTVFAHLLASREFLTGSLLALIVLLLTLIFGRAWCGWICPLGTILDVISPRRVHRSVQRERFSWRGVKYGLLIAILVAALLGNLTLLFLDPLTILLRTLTVSLWPAFDQMITAGERIILKVPPLSEPVMSFDNAIRPELFPYTPVYYRQTFLFALIFTGLVALNWLERRFWCRYLCPLGALLGLLSKLAIFRREVGERCTGCALCESACPTGTIDPVRNYASDPAECTMCLECLDACPRSRITFMPGLNISAGREYDPGRRQALLTIGASIAGVALLRSDMLAQHDHPFRIQPPGGRENDMTNQCIRCGACMRACPTGGLQPAITELGLEGLWTPILVPRLGYCDYSCNACGKVCPVEAIPPLGLEEKRVQTIGTAYIDEKRCIAWADHTECIVCEEMCPLPEKAITLEVRPHAGEEGMMAVPLPKVNRELCIGCGICEFKCPVNGPAAIRVYTPLNL